MSQKRQLNIGNFSYSGINGNINRNSSSNANNSIRADNNSRFTNPMEDNRFLNEEKSDSIEFLDSLESSFSYGISERSERSEWSERMQELERIDNHERSPIFDSIFSNNISIRAQNSQSVNYFPPKEIHNNEDSSKRAKEGEVNKKEKVISRKDDLDRKYDKNSKYLEQKKTKSNVKNLASNKCIENEDNEKMRDDANLIEKYDTKAKMNLKNNFNLNDKLNFYDFKTDLAAILSFLEENKNPTKTLPNKYERWVNEFINTRFIFKLFKEELNILYYNFTFLYSQENFTKFLYLILSNFFESSSKETTNRSLVEIFSQESISNLSNGLNIGWTTLFYKIIVMHQNSNQMNDDNENSYENCMQLFENVVQGLIKVLKYYNSQLIQLNLQTNISKLKCSSENSNINKCDTKLMENKPKINTQDCGIFVNERNINSKDLEDLKDFERSLDSQNSHKRKHLFDCASKIQENNNLKTQKMNKNSFKKFHSEAFNNKKPESLLFWNIGE